jgi:hypothetical protein
MRSAADRALGIGALRTGALGIGTLAAASMLLAGCGLAGPTSVEVNSYHVDGALTALIVQAEAGRVDIVTGTGAVTVTETLRFTGDKPKTSHVTDAGTLRLTDQGCTSHIHGCGVDYRIQVPAAMSVNVDNTAGKVTVTGLAGDLTVKDTAGAVEATGLSSPHVSVHDSAGAITLTFIEPPTEVNVQDQAGAIKMQLPPTVSYNIDAQTTAGKVKIGVPRDLSSSHRITAGDTAGSIDITS